jgi:hypothetical protein
MTTTKKEKTESKPTIRRGLKKAIYGKDDRAEMLWAEMLRLKAEDGGEMGELAPGFDAIVREMAAAALRGNPLPFERLAKCVQFLGEHRGPKPGENTWADPVAAQLIEDMRGPGGVINVEQCLDGLSAKGIFCDRKTLIKRVRELGFSTVRGRPKVK